MLKSHQDQREYQQEDHYDTFTQWGSMLYYLYMLVIWI